MAIPFLNHLDLRSVSELQNAILHKTTEGSASNVRGKLIYDTGTDTIKYYSHPDGGSGSWISLTGDTNTFRTVQADGSAIGSTETLNLIGGTNITLSESGGAITIDGAAAMAFVLEDSSGDEVTINNAKEVKFIGDGISTNWTDVDNGTDGDPYDLTFTNTDKGSSQNIFKTVAVNPSHSGSLTFASSQDLVADSNDDTLKLFDGTGIDITGATSDDIVRIAVDSTVVRTSGAQTIAGDKTFSNEVIINGNLTVSGTQTTKASETVLIEDNIITLNSNETSAASENAGIEVERGSDTNVLLRWTEGDDRWQFTNDGSTYYNIPIPSEYDNFNFSLKAINGSGNTVTQEVADGGTITFDSGQVDSTDGVDVIISGDDKITISHHDTSSQSSVNNTGRTYIQDITLDTYGHITAITSASETVTNTNTQLVTKSALIDVSVMDDTATHRAASIAHNMNSEKIMVQLFDTGSGLVVFADIVHVDENTIKITFASIPANDVRVLMIDLKDSLSDLTPTYSNS